MADAHLVLQRGKCGPNFCIGTPERRTAARTICLGQSHERDARGAPVGRERRHDGLTDNRGPVGSVTDVALRPRCQGRRLHVDHPRCFGDRTWGSSNRMSLYVMATPLRRDTSVPAQCDDRPPRTLNCAPSVGNSSASAEGGCDHGCMALIPPTERRFVPPSPEEQARFAVEAAASRAEFDARREALKPAKRAVLALGLPLRDIEAAVECGCSCHLTPGSPDRHGGQVCRCQQTDAEREAARATFLSFFEGEDYEADRERDEHRGQSCKPRPIVSV